MARHESNSFFVGTGHTSDENFQNIDGCKTEMIFSKIENEETHGLSHLKRSDDFPSSTKVDRMSTEMKKISDAPCGSFKGLKEDAWQCEEKNEDNNRKSHLLQLLDHRSLNSISTSKRRKSTAVKVSIKRTPHDEDEIIEFCK